MRFIGEITSTVIRSTLGAVFIALVLTAATSSLNHANAAPSGVSNIVATLDEAARHEFPFSRFAADYHETIPQTTSYDDVEDLDDSDLKIKLTLKQRAAIAFFEPCILHASRGAAANISIACPHTFTVLKE